MPSSVQTPKQQIAERAAQAAGLATAAKAVGLQDHRRLLQAHAKRVDDSHRVMARAAGMEDIVSDNSSPEDADMGGDITVTGDIHVGAPEQAKVLEKLLGQPRPQPASTPKMPGWAKLAGTALAGGGIVAASIAGYGAWKEKQPPPVPATESTNTDKWTEYDVRKWTPEAPGDR